MTPIYVLKQYLREFIVDQQFVSAVEEYVLERRWGTKLRKVGAGNLEEMTAGSEIGSDLRQLACAQFC